MSVIPMNVIKEIKLTEAVQTLASQQQANVRFRQKVSWLWNKIGFYCLENFLFSLKRMFNGLSLKNRYKITLFNGVYLRYMGKSSLPWTISNDIKKTTGRLHWMTWVTSFKQLAFNHQATFTPIYLIHGSTSFQNYFRFL